VKAARLLPLALLALALVAGCGSSSSNGLGDALSVVPKDSPLVVAVQTNGASAQNKQLRSLLAHFPGGDQLGQALMSRSSRGGLDFNTDVKPILGNDLVVVPLGSQSPRAGRRKLLLALKASDDAKAAALLAHAGTKVASFNGTAVYRTRGGQSAALQDGLVVEAPTRAQLEQALSRAGGADHMTAADFDARLSGLPADALVRVGGDLQALISQSANGGAARRIPWIDSLQTLGATVAAESDGVAIDFDIRAQGTGLGPGDLPLAAGASSPPVVRRNGEIGIGVRGLDQTIRFVEGAAQAIDPNAARRIASFQRIASRYGVDLQRDVIGQLSGNSSLSIAPAGGFAIRTDLPDPAAFRVTLRKVAPALARFASAIGLHNAALVKPSHGDPFYALAGSNGKRYVFGVVGPVFVLATDSARAADLAARSPGPVPDATGALAIDAAGPALLATVLEQMHQGAAAQLFAAPLGDVTGSVSSSTRGLRGRLKLAIH
jgi:hypothetical protein